MRDGQLRLPGLRPLLLKGLYILCIGAPLSAAVAGETRSRGFYREVSADMAVAGLAMLFMQFALSGRFKFVSGNIGIDSLMRFHQMAARVVLGLLIMHPFLLVTPALWVHPLVAAKMLSMMFTSHVLWSGTTAWLLLVLLVPIAIYRDRLPISYEVWRLSHGIGGIAAVTLGMYSRHPYRVFSKTKVGDQIWEILLEPRNGDVNCFHARSIRLVEIRAITISRGRPSFFHLYDSGFQTVDRFPC